MLAIAAAVGGAQAAQRHASSAVADMSVEHYVVADRYDEYVQRRWLLLVYVPAVDVSEPFSSSRLQLRIRYGASGSYQERVSRKVRCMPNDHQQARAEFDAASLFTWNRNVQPVVTVQLVKLGFIDRTVGQASVRLPFLEGRPGAVRQDLCLHGKKSQEASPVGRMSVFLEARLMSQAEFDLGIDCIGLAERPSLAPQGRRIANEMNELLELESEESPRTVPNTVPVVVGCALPTASFRPGAPGVVQGSVASEPGHWRPGAIEGSPVIVCGKAPRDSKSHSPVPREERRGERSLRIVHL
mmetsp:Transcript_18/g.54  ORF Transcript_18/g.54 Transcript_18/m.54 type:complete len:299 (+) Transcript_18:69-965(+)